MKPYLLMIAALALVACADLDQMQRRHIGMSQKEIGIWKPSSGQPLLPVAQKFTNAPVNTTTPAGPYTNNPVLPSTNAPPAKKKPWEKQK